MKIGFYSWYKVLNGNRLFAELPTHEWGVEGSNYPFVLLGRHLRARGHEVSTIDTGDIGDYQRIVFLEFPEFRTSGRPNRYLRAALRRGFRELYLVCLETPAIKPNNWHLENHAWFKKIFTWHDQLIDGRRYIRLYSTSHRRDEVVYSEVAAKRKLCAMVARNKCTTDSRELYSERLRAIQWFEQHHPDDFDLYGVGWDRYLFRGRLRRLNLVHHYISRGEALLGPKHNLGRAVKGLAKCGRIFGRLEGRSWPGQRSYRGPVASVRETLRDYRFSICFENSSYPGWITERIFTSFLAGCVPVYLGDPLIGEKIPDTCFIDNRKFGSYAELYDYLTKMPESEYLRYLGEIRDFLSEPRSDVFTAERFAETIAEEVVG